MSSVKDSQGTGSKFLAAVYRPDGTVFLSAPHSDIRVSIQIATQMDHYPFYVVLYELRLMSEGGRPWRDVNETQPMSCGIFQQLSDGRFMRVFDAAPTFEAGVAALRNQLRALREK